MKPKISPNCGANLFAAPDERIIEFSTPNGGGLISIQYVTGTRPEPPVGDGGRYSYVVIDLRNAEGHIFVTSSDDTVNIRM